MSVLTPHTFPEPTLHRPHRAAKWAIGIAVVLVITAVGALAGIRYIRDDSRRQYLGSDGWPSHGQAAYVLNDGSVRATDRQRPVPIASVAKVMTALVVLRTPGQFDLHISNADVADTQHRRQRDESVVKVAAGEVLTERQALAAVLLPSANNVAVMLARRVAGSVAAFVARMNALARTLGMMQTRYTDPSGYAASTRSTAADQVRLAQFAMHDATFAQLVGLRDYRLPVAGTVRNTDTLLGHGGFVGIKTGSMDASGGCFMFRARRAIGGRTVLVTGVVLGQPGHNLILAGQYAARQLVNRLTSSS